jgi:hypothetical protein
VRQLDGLLADYLHELYERNDGGGKSLAACTLYGIVKFMPHCEKKLHTSSMSLRGWLKLRPSQSYPPLTYDLAVLIACHMSMKGHLRYGIGVLVAFHCLLRVGELCNIRKDDIADAGDPRLGKEYEGISIRLPKTKTGANQWVTVLDDDIAALLRLLVEESDDVMFPFTSSDFREVFKSTCAQLGLSRLYVPHSLRHGGATRLHLLGWSIEDILLRGRWMSHKSARRYIQAGRAMLLTVKVPQKVARIAKTLSSDVLYSVLSSLPQNH